MDFNAIATSLSGFISKHQNAQAIILGENHSDHNSNIAMLSSPAVLKVLKAHNFNTLAVEHPAPLQKHVNDVIWNGMSASTFTATAKADFFNAGRIMAPFVETVYKNQGELIQAQAKAGNIVLYYDNPHLSMRETFNGIETSDNHFNKAQKIAEDVTRSKALGVYEKLHLAGSGDEESIHRAAAKMHFEAISRNPEARDNFITGFLMRVNPRDEKERANYILNNKTDGKVIALGGHYHGSSKNDLDEMLGAVRLTIIPDLRTYYQASQRDYTLSSDPPEGYLVLSTGSIIPGDVAMRQAQAFDQKFDRLISATPLAPLTFANYEKPKTNTFNTGSML